MTEPNYFENLFKESYPVIFDRARALRKDMTSAEIFLWEFLRNRQLGVKFRRQHAIAEFIADFYCHDKKLVIELDGEIHNAQQEYDSYRSAALNSMGLRVLRFTNYEVMDDTENVLRKILEYL